MKLREMSGLVKAAAFARVAFIIDASESATEYQREIVALTQQVMSELPARVQRTLYFLGNPSGYDPNQFARQAPQWFEENRQRASLMTPVYEALAGDDNLIVVIIGSGKIYDLEDWMGTPSLRRTLLVSMGESLRGALSVVEEIVKPTAHELCQRLYDPVTSVHISGPGFMPIRWDNSGYRLNLAAGNASLIGERLEDYSLTLRYFAIDLVKATMTHANGKKSITPIEAVEDDATVAKQVGWLTTEEVAIFRKAVHQEPFTCIHCGEQHPWDTLYCLHGAIILGELVYLSLQQHNATGFVLFRFSENGVSFELCACNVLRLDIGMVAIKEGKKATIYRFDDQKEEWVKMEGALKPYHQVREGEYAILI